MYIWYLYVLAILTLFQMQRKHTVLNISTDCYIILLAYIPISIPSQIHLSPGCQKHFL